MKKILLSLLFSAVLCLGASKSLNVSASQEQPELKLVNALSETNEWIEVVEEVPVVGASLSEIQVRPDAELNPELVTYSENAILLEGNAYVWVKMDCSNAVAAKAFLYDAEGNATGYYKMIYNSANDDRVVCFKMDEFSGTKEYMIGLYSNDSVNGYQYIAGKEFTVTAKDWTGSLMGLSVTLPNNFHNSYNASFLNLPADVDTSDLDVKVYDGDVPIARVEWDSFSESNYVYLDSLLGQEFGAYLQIANPILSARCYIYWIKEPTLETKCEVRAISGGKTYELGCIYTDNEPSVGISALNAHSKMGMEPMVVVSSTGYDKSKLVLEILDETTGEVLATSEGGKFLQQDENWSYHTFVTDMTRDELDGCPIVVKYNGEIIKTNVNFEYEPVDNIVRIYYDDAQDKLVVLTHGIPDGTVVSLSLDGTIYIAQGTVQNSKAVMNVMARGQSVELPEGNYSITCTYKVGDTDRQLMKFMQFRRAGGLYTINLLKKNYFTDAENIYPEILVSKTLVTSSKKDFYAVLYLNGTQVGGEYELNATESVYLDEDCWLLTGDFGMLNAGNYQVYVYNDDKQVTGTSMCVGEAGKVYGTLSVTYSHESGTQARAYIHSWNDAMDENLLSVKVTDYWGNDIGVTAELTSAGVTDYEAYFEFKNVPEGYISIEGELMYDGEPVGYTFDIGGEKTASKTFPYYSDYYSFDFNSEYVDSTITYVDAFYIQKPSYVKVVKNVSLDVVATWEFPEHEWVYLTEEMLEELSQENAREIYDVYMYSKDGKSYSFLNGICLRAYTETEVVENGIGRATDGNYYLYVNGEVNTAYTGLYYWVEKDEWVMIVSGLLDTSYTALTFYNDTWWYVENGYVNFNFTGLVTVGLTQWYVVNGQIDFTYQGLICFLDVWYYVENGAVAQYYNGLAFVNDAWWYVVNGRIDFTYTGLAFVNEKWWYVNQGRIDFTYHGICEFNGETYYIQGGEINYTASGLVCVDPDWYFVENGKVRRDYSGMLFVNDAWWYVVRGQIDFNFSGLFFFNNDWWFVSQGKIVLGYIGLVFFDNQWWYLENGVVNFNYNGFAYVNDIWWWVVNGNIDFNHTGIHAFNGIWWYVKGAQIDFTYNGTVIGPDGNTYEVVNGEVRGYTGD